MLYCLQNNIFHKGNWSLAETFYGDEETARMAFEESKRITAFTHETTLWEIDTKGCGFDDPRKISFKKYRDLEYSRFELPE
jgi:hypothetical protein